ncbi:MAG: sulfurtransferase [Bryobacterales bacterium]|nr:sulfurtransferase [Bryobacterales bacterium]
MKTHLAVLALVCAPLLAQQTNPSMLVSTGWLASHLGDQDLVILHTGSAKDYDAGHIPGARLVTLAEISVTDASGLRLELPPAAALADAFGKLGVSDRSRIVVYPGTSAVPAATRVWFTLDYLGLGGRAALLDGGLALWRAQGRPLSTEAAPPPAPEKITPHPSPNRVVTSDWLRTHLKDPKVDLLDTRPPDFFSGANPGEFTRGGHIPGARNVPLAQALRPDGTLQPAGALRELMTPPGGKRRASTVTYCNTGQQATVLYFVGRYLGLDVKLYDGSMQDWSREFGLPVESFAR